MATNVTSRNICAISDIVIVGVQICSLYVYLFAEYFSENLTDKGVLIRKRSF